MSKKKIIEDKTNHVEIKAEPGKSRDQLITELAIGGLCNNASLIVNFSKDSYGNLNLMDCIGLLSERAKTVHTGNLHNLETILTSQAHALNVLFSSLAYRAKTNMGEYTNAAEKYMKLALKAQSQCRTTIEAIAIIKNPQPYVRQLNQANNMQVNNNGQEPGMPHARENIKATNELLEEKHHDTWLDTGTSGATSPVDTKLATVEK